MARIMKANEMPKPRKQQEERSSTPRLKAVFRIIDSWGSKLIKEYPYKDRLLAEQRLEQYIKEGKSYYLQLCKVPM